MLFIRTGLSRARKYLSYSISQSSCQADETSKAKLKPSVSPKTKLGIPQFSKRNLPLASYTKENFQTNF